MSRHFLRYLTALGASALGGQWGSWQLTDSPEAPSTASWRLNFMSADWRTMRISADGNLSAIAKPMEILGTNQWRTQKPLVITSCPCQYIGVCANVRSYNGGLHAKKLPHVSWLFRTDRWYDRCLFRGCTCQLYRYIVCLRWLFYFGPFHNVSIHW